MDKNKKKIKRLIADINEDLHIEIKTMASFHNVSMKKYITQAILQKLNTDKKYLTEKEN